MSYHVYLSGKRLDRGSRGVVWTLEEALRRLEEEGREPLAFSIIVRTRSREGWITAPWWKYDERIRYSRDMRAKSEIEKAVDEERRRFQEGRKAAEDARQERLREEFARRTELLASGTQARREVRLAAAFASLDPRRQALLTVLAEELGSEGVCECMLAFLVTRAASRSSRDEPCRVVPLKRK